MFELIDQILVESDNKFSPGMHSISNILIANRGEIARRIIRTAKGMGISTFAIYTDEEKTALHVQEADQSCSLGSGSLSETYLNIPLIIKIAKENHCDAIHPGYGFLSENAAFAAACKSQEIIFIGPGSDEIRLMGNKTEARKFIKGLGISLPVSIVGTSYEDILPKLDKLKFPFIIKACAGGGGKGMKIIKSPSELSDGWLSASREALAYFGDASVYLEHYMEGARHIEVQVLGDSFGNVVHLYDRECTIQRRHQKIIEEAPSPTLSEEVRQRMLDTALFIARSMNYISAGTIEFLVDQELNFYFLEMNTRIQVEHPVTEAVTGIDIVKEQINIAQGRPISFSQNEIQLKSHAVECRIYAEDPFDGFLPSSGSITLNYLPESSNIRIDSAFEGPAIVSSNFDPLIAKVIAHSASRLGAINQLHSLLKKSAIHGIKTNLEYLAEILEEKDFRENNISTGYCELKAESLKRSHLEKINQIDPAQIIATALISYFNPEKYSGNNSVWHKLGPWRNLATMAFSINSIQYEITYQLFGTDRINFILDQKQYLISGIENQRAAISFQLNGLKVGCKVSGIESGTIISTLQGFNFVITRTDMPDISIFNQKQKVLNHFSDGHIISPLNGKIIQLNVKLGDKVRKGEILMIIESMKMENNIVAPAEAVVAELNVASGDQVVGSELLLKLTMLN